MSIIQKLNKLTKTLNVNSATLTFYSRHNFSKKVDSPYKIVKSRARLDDGVGEGGPNWELFAPRGNRFYLPGSLGPAWQNSSTTIQCETTLDSLIDFEGKAESKLRFTAKQCPTLIKKNIHEIFPAPEVVSNDGLTLITLQYCNDHFEYEKGASKFVLAAREICSRLRLNGYWADFMNPFSGKPFYSYASGKNLYKIDERFRGIGMKIQENQSNCLIISQDNDSTFSGSVFTNAPSNERILKSLIEE